MSQGGVEESIQEERKLIHLGFSVAFAEKIFVIDSLSLTISKDTVSPSLNFVYIFFACMNCPLYQRRLFLIECFDVIGR